MSWLRIARHIISVIICGDSTQVHMLSPEVRLKTRNHRKNIIPSCQRDPLRIHIGGDKLHTVPPFSRLKLPWHVFVAIFLSSAGRSLALRYPLLRIVFNV